VARAKEIGEQLGGGEKLTVSLVRASEDGVEAIAVTVNNEKAYEALRTGAVKLAENEFLGLPPMKLKTWLRNYWGNVNLHAEELGIRTMKALGRTAGEVATSRPGCEKCQHIIGALNGIFKNEWVHLNPKPNEVIRPAPNWR
jgi:hypothetical protein